MPPVVAIETDLVEPAAVDLPGDADSMAGSLDVPSIQDLDPDEDLASQISGLSQVL